jgi:hypothetical protein
MGHQAQAAVLIHTSEQMSPPMTKTLFRIGGYASSCHLLTERAKFAIQSGKGGYEICATHPQTILTLRPLLPHPSPAARLAADSKIETDGVANLILLIGPLQSSSPRTHGLSRRPTLRSTVF